MGVKTPLTLVQVNQLFSNYQFTILNPSISGIIDTTYFLSDGNNHYVIKRFERAKASDIQRERQLLKALAQCHINVPRYLESSENWHLYTRLAGNSPSHPSLPQLKTVARTLAKMHHCTQKMSSTKVILSDKEMQRQRQVVKQKSYYSFHKLKALDLSSRQHSGLIHGDLFLDNILFDADKIGIIDFIDAAQGSLAFDLGVTAMAWTLRGASIGRLKLFLQSYNQMAPLKISFEALRIEVIRASLFYTLNRINNNAGDYGHNHIWLKKVKQLARGTHDR